MGRVFVSHDSNDAKAVTDDFVNIILRDGCGLRDADLFYSSDPRTGVPAGHSIIGDVRDALDSSPVVVALLTVNAIHNPWVMMEAGGAWALSDRDSMRAHDDTGPSRHFVPVFIPPVGPDNAPGVVEMVKGLDAGNRDEFELLKATLRSNGFEIDGNTFWRHVDRWMDLVEAMPTSAVVDRNAVWLQRLNNAAHDSSFDSTTLERFARRTSTDISLAGGAIATDIRSNFTVRRAEGSDYWLYDLTTRTTYRGLPEQRAKQEFSLVPYVLQDLVPAREPDVASLEEGWHGEPWIIALSPVLRRTSDWDKFRDDAHIEVRAWKEGEAANPPEWIPLDRVQVDPKSLPDGDEAAQDDGAHIAAVEFAATNLGSTWDVIEVAFRNIPHSTELPAMYFYASDTCEGFWRFRASSPNQDIEARATSLASWRDVVSDQGTDGQLGTETTLKPITGMLMFKHDVVLVTLRDAPQAAN